MAEREPSSSSSRPPRRPSDRSTTLPELAARYVPITRWLPAYPREWLRPDLVAALTSWGVMVPVALAYAGLAGRAARAGPRDRVRGARGLRRLRDEPPPEGDRQLDDGDHVGIRGRRPRRRRRRGLRRLHRRPRPDRRRHARRGRRRATRLHLGLPRQVGGDGVHRRAVDHDHRRPAAQAPRRAGPERLAARAGRPARRRAPGHEHRDARGRPRRPGPDPRPAPDLAPDPGAAYRARAGDRGRRGARPRRARGERGRRGRHRPAAPVDPAVCR